MTITLTSPSTSVEKATFSNDTISYTFDGSAGWCCWRRVTPVSKSTTSEKGLKEEEGEEVGKVHMHTLKKDEVVVNGKTIELKLKSKLSTKKHFVASNGQTYTWKACYDEATLKDDQDQIVAQYKKGSSGYIGKAKDSVLEMEDGLEEEEEVMDEVFVTFVYMVQEARIRMTTNMAVAANA